MKFADPRLLLFRDELIAIAHNFGLDPANVLVESFIPNNHVIVVESVGHRRVRLHINLQEKRIVSAKELGTRQLDWKLFEKYLEYMK